MRFCSVLLLILIGCSTLVSAQTYEEKRKEILNRQTNTRAEINVLDARIKTYQQRIQQTENRYEELYKQYQSEIDLREKDLEQLKQNLRDILLYTYKNGRASNLELIVTAGSINQMVIRSYYLQKLEEQKEKQAEQIRVRQRELEGVKDDLQ